MEDDNKYDVQDLVLSAMEQKPEEFAQGFNSIMIDKLNAAIANRKYEMAQSVFEDPNDEDYEDDEYEDEDIEDQDQMEFEYTDAEQETDLNPEE